MAAYSPRIRPGLPVSAPVGWDALDDVRPGGLHRDARRRERFGDADPWAAELPEPQELPADLVAEGHTIPIARVAGDARGQAPEARPREAAPSGD